MFLFVHVNRKITNKNCSAKNAAPYSLVLLVRGLLEGH